jgi:hypothetical protein
MDFRKAFCAAVILMAVSMATAACESGVSEERSSFRFVDTRGDP